jgi:hypothetical protein
VDLLQGAIHVITGPAKPLNPARTIADEMEPAGA